MKESRQTASLLYLFLRMTYEATIIYGHFRGDFAGVSHGAGGQLAKTRALGRGDKARANAGWQGGVTAQRLEDHSSRPADRITWRYGDEDHRQPGRQNRLRQHRRLARPQRQRG